MGTNMREESLHISRRERGNQVRPQIFESIAEAVLQNDVVGIAVLDTVGAYKAFNRGAELITGYTREDVVGKTSPPELFSDEDRKLIRGRLDIHGGIDNMDIRIKRKDGFERDVILSMSSGRGKDGAVLEHVQFFVDNSEKKYLQELLLHSQKMEIVGEMAGGIAHDFNNLLEGILGYTTFMMDLIGEDHELRSYLEIIKRSAIKASDLTERLLTFSRDGGRDDTLVNSNTLLREVVKLLERSVDKRIVIELDLERNLKAVLGSGGQLEQAFLNICLNARDAMPEGGKLLISSGHVTIDSSYPRLSWKMKHGRYVRVSISDTGAGMDPETKARMFKPFFTTKKRGEGTGLGLNMVYGIIDNHGGFIKVYSEKGKGTVFNIYLPAHEEEAPHEVLAGEKREVPEGKNEMVLMIDDEPVIQDVGRDMLQKLGYRALVASGAEDGLKIFGERKDEIDLVILDVIMPGANGFDVMREIAELKPGVLVLLSSGYNRSFFGEDLIDDKQVNFIQKPYSMEDLAIEVRSVIDGAADVTKEKKEGVE